MARWPAAWPEPRPSAREPGGFDGENVNTCSLARSQTSRGEGCHRHCPIRVSIQSAKVYLGIEEGPGPLSLGSLLLLETRDCPESSGTLFPGRRGLCSKAGPPCVLAGTPEGRDSLSWISPRRREKLPTG